MTSIPTFRPWYRRALDALIERAATLRRSAVELRTLDARALADIGVHPSEIGSIEAEARGPRGAVTRLRIAAAHG